MSKNKDRQERHKNNLAGWAEVIRESGRLHRQKEAEYRKQKADEMRELFHGQERVQSTHALVWRRDIPYLTTNTPDFFLESVNDRMLAMVWDEMYRRKSWLSDFSDFLKMNPDK